MIVMDAGVLEGHLILWGETPFDPAISLRRKNDRKGMTISAKGFPYDAGREFLEAATREAGIGFPVKSKSVVGNWKKEASRFTPDLSVMVHHGRARAKGDEYRKRPLAGPWSFPAMPFSLAIL